MSKNLVVVLGAGASFDCVGPGTPKDPKFTPPLVTQLFANRDSFVEIQKIYPWVSGASSEIRAYTQDSSSIEQYIRETYKEAVSPDDKKIYFELPLYLQHLLFSVSKNYTPQPDNYHLLINATRRLDSVVYVTLNYDLILDNILTTLFELSSLDSYIDNRKNWSFIKLHGSVNWCYEVGNRVEGADERNNFRDTFAGLSESLEVNTGEIVLRTGDDLNEIRFQSTPGRLFYPALSVPVGTYDELVCPFMHIEFLKKKLEEMKSLNLLVIGYSGNDIEIMKLLEDSKKNINTLIVVSGSKKSSSSVVQKMSEKLGFIPKKEMAYDNTFNNFVRDRTLTKFINTLT